MSEIGFDPAAGTLILTPALLSGMVAVHRDDDVSEAIRSELTKGRILDDGAIHRRLRSVAEVAASPLTRITLKSSASGAASQVEGWIGERFALLLSLRDEATQVYDATFLTRSLLPLHLARSVGLAPRERAKVTDPVELDLALLETLLGPGPAFTTSQVESLTETDEGVEPAWVEQLSRLSERVSRWRVGAWWNSAEESPAARSLEVLDTEHGILLVSHPPRGGRRYRRARLHPMTPSQIWRLLCAFVPPAEHVREPLSS